MAYLKRSVGRVMSPATICTVLSSVALWICGGTGCNVPYGRPCNQPDFGSTCPSGLNEQLAVTGSFTTAEFSSCDELGAQCVFEGTSACNFSSVPTWTCNCLGSPQARWFCCAGVDYVPCAAGVPCCGDGAKVICPDSIDDSRFTVCTCNVHSDAVGTTSCVYMPDGGVVATGQTQFRGPCMTDVDCPDVQPKCRNKQCSFCFSDSDCRDHQVCADNGQCLAYCTLHACDGGHD